MARLYGRDVRDTIVNLLNSGGTKGDGTSIDSFNTTIGTINTERSESTPTAKKITHKWGYNQFQWVFVDVGDSEVPNDLMDDEFSQAAEFFEVVITGYLKSSNEEIYNYAENWIEAFIRILHGYYDADITHILVTGTIRDTLYQPQKETMKMGGVTLVVRIN